MFQPFIYYFSDKFQQFIHYFWLMFSIIYPIHFFFKLLRYSKISPNNLWQKQKYPLGYKYRWLGIMGYNWKKKKKGERSRIISWSINEAYTLPTEGIAAECNYSGLTGLISAKTSCLLLVVVLTTQRFFSSTTPYQQQNNACR